MYFHKKKALDLCKITRYNKGVPKEGTKNLQKEGFDMKKMFWENLAETCAAVEMNMGLDIGHLLSNDSKRWNTTRA